MSLRRLENSLSGSSISLWGVSYSVISPKLSTMTRSEFIIVLSLWAMVIMVDPANSVAISSCIFYSVTTSILAVASSKMTTFDWRRMALQMQISCRSPELKFTPESWIFWYKPV